MKTASTPNFGEAVDRETLGWKKSDEKLAGRLTLTS
jgi:hypothetical protein